MRSMTATLLDPFEIADTEGSGPRRCLRAVEDETEWFERATLGFLEVALVEEINEAPPWTPEPVDRRWRGRAWSEDD